MTKDVLKGFSNLVTSVCEKMIFQTNAQTWNKCSFKMLKHTTWPVQQVVDVLFFYQLNFVFDANLPACLQSSATDVQSGKL